MRKPLLILVLGLVLAACAAEAPEVETRVVVVTTTPVPPTATLVPPTATSLPPTAAIYTPTPSWDAKVDGIAANLRQLPDDASQTVITLLGGTTVEVRAVTEDKEWVEVAYWEGGSATKGWLRVNTLELNISLDKLEVDANPETDSPPTRAPEPVEVSLEEQYINHFLEKGFEYNPDREQYLKEARWGELMIDVNEGESYIFGYFEFETMTPEEASEVLDHLEEASNFLDPGNGWDTVRAALGAISNGQLMGTAENSQGRDLFFEARPFDNDPPTWLMLFTYSDEE